MSFEIGQHDGRRPMQDRGSLVMLLIVVLEVVVSVLKHVIPDLRGTDFNSNPVKGKARQLP